MIFLHSGFAVIQCFRLDLQPLVAVENLQQRLAVPVDPSPRTKADRHLFKHPFASFRIVYPPFAASDVDLSDKGSTFDFVSKPKSAANCWSVHRDIINEAIVLVVDVQVAVSDLGREPVLEWVAQAAIELKGAVRGDAETADVVIAGEIEAISNGCPKRKPTIGLAQISF